MARGCPPAARPRNGMNLTTFQLLSYVVGRAPAQLLVPVKLPACGVASGQPLPLLRAGQEVPESTSSDKLFLGASLELNLG